jgi:tRNA(Ile)-lysidine synthase
VPAAEGPLAAEGQLAAAQQPVSSAEAAHLFADLAHHRGLVLAISGGPDSTALLLLVARWRATLARGPKLLAVTIDHGMRAESAAEARAARRVADALNVAHRTLRWTGRKPNTGLQAAARAARYRLLASAARKAGARHVLTAHTLDDQAETVLFRLARGSGLTGLAGMARVAPLPVSGAEGIMLVRPLLTVPKARLVASVQAARIPFAQDPSNRDPRFTRTRLREVMPVMAEHGLDARRIALLARRAARAEAAIEAAVAAAAGAISLTQWSNSGPILLRRKRFADLPAEVALRLLGRAIARLGDEGPVELGKLEALFDAVSAGMRDGSALRRTLAGAVVSLAADRLVVEKAPPRRRKAGPGQQKASSRSQKASPRHLKSASRPRPRKSPAQRGLLAST